MLAPKHIRTRLTLEEFLEGESGQGMATNVSDYASLADFLHWLAGDMGKREGERERGDTASLDFVLDQPFVASLFPDRMTCTDASLI